MTSYKSIFISDLHLGTPGCSASELCDFLKNNDCERLYLVGDIIDGWQLSKKMYWPQEHSDVIRRILTKAKRGTKVYWIVGNHDEMLRNWFDFRLQFGRIRVLNEYVHHAVNGKKYLVTHGDLFDGITKVAPWLSFLGDKAYDFILAVNTKYNRLRHAFGFGYWSISKYLKLQIKRAVNFIFQFESNLVDYCRRKGYDGVICGHIHTAQIKNIDGIIYMNDGDWVESCTALVEHIDGKWEIVTWNEIQ